jgi:hypothetical protein
VQGVEQRASLLLSYRLSFLGCQVLDLALDLVNLAELLERELGDLALVGRVQFEELAPGVSQTAGLDDPARLEPLLVANASQLSPDWHFS